MPSTHSDKISSEWHVTFPPVSSNCPTLLPYAILKFQYNEWCLCTWFHSMLVCWIAYFAWCQSVSEQTPYQTENKWCKSELPVKDCQSYRSSLDFGEQWTCFIWSQKLFITEFLLGKLHFFESIEAVLRQFELFIYIFLFFFCLVCNYYFFMISNGISTVWSSEHVPRFRGSSVCTRLRGA